MELSCPKKLNKTFLKFLAPKKLNKTSLGETGWLNNLYYLLAAQALSFLIHSQLGHTWYPQKIHFQICSLKKWIFENYIFKIVFSKNINFISLIYSSSESSESSERHSKSPITC